MTHPAMSPEPGPGRTCRVCGTGLEPDSFRCAHCGATYGERNRCPHCGAVADVEPHKTLRYRCRVCGGPRVPLADNTIEPSGVEWPLLEEAQRARMRVAAWRVGREGEGLVKAVVLVLAALAAMEAAVLGTFGPA